MKYLYKTAGFFFLNFIFTITAFAQSPKFWVRGKVIDSIEKDVPYATLRLVKSGIAVVADEKGNFDFGLNAVVEDTLIVSSVSYQDYKLLLTIDSLQANNPLVVKLNFFYKELDPVIVSNKYNLDSILNESFIRFENVYAKGYESEAFIRSVQQQNNIYTGILEAKGYRYDDGFADFKNISPFQTDFHIFFNARSTGFKESGLFNNLTDFSMSHNMYFFLPWQSNWYKKSNIRINDVNRSLMSITLMPKSEHFKDLEKIDKKYGFSINSPSLFLGMKRTYIIDLETSNILSMELESQEPATVKLDRNKRKYLSRRYYYKFNYINSLAYLSYTKADILFITPYTKEEGVWHFIAEKYYQNHKQKKYTDNELYEKFRVTTDKKTFGASAFSYRFQDRSERNTDDRFLGLVFKGNFNKSEWEKKYDPPFHDIKKLISALKDNQYIYDFVSKEEK